MFQEELQDCTKKCFYGAVVEIDEKEFENESFGPFRFSEYVFCDFAENWSFYKVVAVFEEHQIFTNNFSLYHHFRN